MKKLSVIFLILTVLVLLFASCQKRETQTVTITDGRITTKLECDVTNTVGQALELAEIKLGEKDKVSPSADTPVSQLKDSVEVKRLYHVVLHSDGKDRKLDLYGKTVADVLKKAKCKVGKNDIVSPEESAMLKDGMEINVYRRIVVTLTADGKTSKKITEKKTVAAFLKDNGIKLSDDDIVEPSADTMLKEGTAVLVKRVVYKEETVYSDIPYDTQTQYDNSLSEKQSYVKRNGEDGQKRVTYRVTYTDGVETYREIIEDTVIKNAVDKIIVVGKKKEDNGIVSKQKVYDCDGSGNGYYIITYRDGHVEYVDFYGS